MRKEIDKVAASRMARSDFPHGAGGVSVAEGDVAWIHVAHEHPETFEKPEDRLYVSPSWAEMFCCFSAPVGQHLVGEVGRPVERGAGEIEDERPGHDGHFDNPQLVVVTQHFGEVNRECP